MTANHVDRSEVTLIAIGMAEGGKTVTTVRTAVIAVGDSRHRVALGPRDRVDGREATLLGLLREEDIRARIHRRNSINSL